MQIHKKGYKYIDLKQSGLVFIGIGLGVVFWILESALHVLVFEQVDFVEQLYGPQPHEIWMRLTIVGLFIMFGIYSQIIVNARRKAEEKAQFANTELSQIFETAADGMRVVDKEFNVLRVNETFSTLTGMSGEEIIGKKCFEVLHGPLCETDNCPMVRVLDNGQRVEIDSEKVRQDGIRIPCIITATPFRGPDGDIIGIVEDFKDISGRKRSDKELKESQEKLRSLAAHLQVVREKERGRIAHEIHDELGQALTALKMDVHWIRRKLPEIENELVKKTTTMLALIDATVHSVKRIISELRPRLLDDFGLSAAIENHTEEFVKRTGVQCDIESIPEDIILDEARSLALFRIFQETLTNIARHAVATRFSVILKKSDTEVLMKVSDNGRGFLKNQLSSPQSFGIIGMRERAHSFGGSLDITDEKGKGVTVRVTIPVQGKEEKDD